LGLVTIAYDDKGKRSVTDTRPAQLGPSVPDHKEMAALIEAYKKRGK